MAKKTIRRVRLFTGAGLRTQCQTTCRKLGGSPPGRNRVEFLTAGLMTAASPHAHVAVPASSSQFDLFPQGVQVQQLDPKRAVGTGTRVEEMFTVKYERERVVHQVFLDKHGWYCAEHGPACPAVREVTARARDPKLL